MINISPHLFVDFECKDYAGDSCCVPTYCDTSYNCPPHYACKQKEGKGYCEPNPNYEVLSCSQTKGKTYMSYIYILPKEIIQNNKCGIT